ncbi:hypothetical protein SEA_CHEWYVIII_19 [Rhodococcus phage ChewyVIII]|uniref:Uncharacterized protein n=1 Tax=Rhodococcus phage ChewyVIII TaxID=1887657 RepID=A0A1C9EI53_9CAUD|nr:hypothetical protein QEH30_gp19 [Rhodococcus phage ChewyVIII]AON97442.1 hypothetical protein SEA_CHEWYVIII_19 [Rhodococcus phage ChewyVIII]
MSDLVFYVLLALASCSAFFSAEQIEREVSGKNRTVVNLWWLFWLILEVVFIVVLIVKWG